MESIAQFFAQISTLSGRLFALKKEGQVPTEDNSNATVCSVAVS